MYSLSNLRKKANKAELSFQKGYQRWFHRGYGYVRDCTGEPVTGYQILDYRTGSLVKPSYTDMYDHALTLDEAIELLKELCAERGVAFK